MNTLNQAASIAPLVIIVLLIIGLGLAWKYLPAFHDKAEELLQHLRKQTGSATTGAAAQPSAAAPPAIVPATPKVEIAQPAAAPAVPAPADSGVTVTARQPVGPIDYTKYGKDLTNIITWQFGGVKPDWFDLNEWARQNGVSLDTPPEMVIDHGDKGYLDAKGTWIRMSHGQTGEIRDYPLHNVPDGAKVRVSLGELNGDLMARCILSLIAPDGTDCSITKWKTDAQAGYVEAIKPTGLDLCCRVNFTQLGSGSLQANVMG